MSATVYPIPDGYDYLGEVPRQLPEVADDLHRDLCELCANPSANQAQAIAGRMTIIAGTVQRFADALRKEGRHDA